MITRDEILAELQQVRAEKILKWKAVEALEAEAIDLGNRERTLLNLLDRLTLDGEEH